MRAASTSVAISFLICLLAAGVAQAASIDTLRAPSCAIRGVLPASADSTRSSEKSPAESTGSSAASKEPARVPSRYSPPDTALIRALTQGGYILVFRHGKTDWGQRDADLVDFADRRAQRNLSEQGRAQSTETGLAITRLGIPVGMVAASPMWRCRDTATLAFGHADTTIDLFQKGSKSREARIRMLSTPPPRGTNTVLVTHQDVLIPIMQIRRDELGEGEALIVKPLGRGAFEILAQVAPADWNRFALSRKL